MSNAYTPLEATVNELALMIKAPSKLLPSYRVSEDGALPHIVIDDAGQYHFIVVERGRELKHMQTKDLQELLYWVFDTVTFSMACSYELHNRVSHQDFRVLLFQYQEELLGILSEEWKQTKIREHLRILEMSPFDDEIN